MSPLDVTSPPNVIIGCGYLGRRIAQIWLSSGRRVIALTRGNAELLATLGIESVIGDVLDPSTLRRLPAADTIVYAVGFDRTAGKGMRDVYVNGLDNLLASCGQCRRFIYISSTSVYGQTGGEIVDERSPTEPVEDSGKIVLEAERLLRDRRPNAIFLRFAGIYGPGRLLRRQTQLQSGEPISGDPERWLNLIHVGDGASAVLAAEAHAAPGETYNIVDDEPTPRRAFYALLAELVGAAAPQFSGQLEARANNRRVNNTKAKTALKWLPRYPSYREGLPTAVKESTT